MATGGGKAGGMYSKDMNSRKFAPGFRLSVVDVTVLIAGAGLTMALMKPLGWSALAVLFVVLHFFLFCNVFRISRPPELIWAGVFVALAFPTILYGVPGWLPTVVICLGLSAGLIIRETRKPSYHGIGWQRLNPGLREWWEKRQESSR